MRLAESFAREAVEQLAHVAKIARSGERVTLNATDPLNVVGLIVPGATVPAVNAGGNSLIATSRPSRESFAR